jgi:prepilin-type processing-associated H-X9-DG protein
MTGTSTDLLRPVGGTVSGVHGLPRRREPKQRSKVRIWVWRLLEMVILVMFGAFALLALAQADQADRQHRCRVQLETLGQAMYAYHEANGHFPPAALSGRDGGPLLSWRVALLPYLGRRDLYEAFRLDEPWDGPHNRALLSEMPAVFACPGEPAHAEGLTSYQVVVGPAGPPDVPKPLFERGRSVEIREVTDGTSNTVMVVEADRPVPWTKPDDIDFDRDAPTPSFGKHHPGGFNALFADGSVKFLKHSIDEKLLRNLLTRDGGEVVSGG